MRKRWFSMLVVILVIAAMTIPAFAQVAETEQTNQIISYDFENEKLESISKIKTRAASDMNEEPYNPPVSKQRSMEVDATAHSEFEDAGLIDEDGNFDWDALAELPSLDGTQIAPRTVLGPDDRVPVTDTTVSPYRYVAYLLMNFNGSYYRGTGFSIGNNAIGSCAHNIYSHDEGGWATSVTVIPARNGNTYPYGSTTATNMRTVTGWTQSRLPEHDWSVIETSANVASQTGYCGIYSRTASIVGKTVELPGFPGSVNGATTYLMHTATGTVLSQSSNLRVYYDADTSGGNSGGPVFIDGAYVTAIHAYGGTYQNSGRRVDDTIYNVYMQYR